MQVFRTENTQQMWKVVNSKCITRINLNIKPCFLVIWDLNPVSDWRWQVSPHIPLRTALSFTHMSIFLSSCLILAVCHFFPLSDEHACSHTQNTHTNTHTPEVPCGSCLEHTFFPSEVPLWNYWTQREIGQFNPLYFTPSLFHSSSLVSLLTCLSQWCLPPPFLPVQLSVHPDSKAIIVFPVSHCILSFHLIFFSLSLHAKQWPFSFLVP